MCASDQKKAAQGKRHKITCISKISKSCLDIRLYGRFLRLRLLTVVDEYTRESLAIHVDTSVPSSQVKTVLQILFIIRGVPTYLRSDNGSEFIAKLIQDWLKEKGVKTKYIEPGKPWQNPFGESFNGRF